MTVYATKVLKIAVYKPKILVLKKIYERRVRVSTKLEN
jgi:hypothetical protein